MPSDKVNVLMVPVIERIWNKCPHLQQRNLVRLKFEGPRVYWLRSKDPRKTLSKALAHLPSKVPVLGIDIDIGNNSVGSLRSPGTLAVYRNNLKRSLSRLEHQCVYGGVWSGDGLKLIAIYSGDYKDYMGYVASLLFELRQILVAQNRLRGGHGKHYLRIGVYYGLENRSFASVQLGRHWDNPQVDLCSSSALEEAEKLQDGPGRCKATNRVKTPRDVLVFSAYDKNIIKALLDNVKDLIKKSRNKSTKGWNTRTGEYAWLSLLPKPG